MRSSLIVVFLAVAAAQPAHAQFGAKKFKIQASADTNAIVPDFFTKRDFVPIKTIAAAGGDLAWFPGRVIYKDGGGEWVFLPVVVKGSPSWEVKVAAIPYSFHSNINREYKGSATVPAVAISASMTNAYDYEIRDVATIAVPDSNVPDKSAIEASMTARGLPTTTPVYCVSAVTLTTVSVKTAAEVKSGGTITGVGFSVGGSTYDASSAASFIPMVCLGTTPMNDAAISQTLALKPAAPSESASSSAPIKLTVKAFSPDDPEAKAFSLKFQPRLTGGGVISRIKVEKE